MWNPVEYAQNTDEQQSWVKTLLHEVKKRGDEAILDVGCGNGKVTADFAKTLPDSRIVGVDSSAEMIAYANRTYPNTIYPNLLFNQLNTRSPLVQAKLSLHFQEEFDLCFSNATLNWVNNHQNFLHEASQVLRTGGRLVISCSGKSSAKEILNIFAELMSLDRWQKYFHNFHDTYSFYGDQDYSIWLEEARFKVEQLKLIPQDVTHPGRDGLKDWISTTWTPFTHSVPIEQRDNFVDQFVDKYLANHPLDKWGYSHVTMVKQEACLIKY
jgi:trans-aconitate 2-methyltransferase